MTYVQLKDKLLVELTDFLDNGFKQKIVMAVEDRILPELKGLVVDLHQKALETRDGTCVHYRDMLQKDVDRKTGVLTDRIGTLEMYMPQVRVLDDAVKELRQGHELQRVATAKLETCTEHLEEFAQTLGGKVNGQAGQLNKLQDRPGEEALENRGKWKWALVGGGITLLAAGGGILLMALI